MNVADLVVVLVNQQECGLGTPAIDAEVSQLPGPAWKTSGFAEFIFEICNFLFRLDGFFLRDFEFFLRSRDFSAETILAIVQVALAEQLGVEIFELQIKQQTSIGCPLRIVAGFLKGGAPILFVAALVIEGTALLCGGGSWRLGICRR